MTARGGIDAFSVSALDNCPYFSYILSILLTRDAFARVLLRRSGSGSRGRNDTLRARADLGIDRPAWLPVREVLAALAPGRVLPFAPGDSRKRGPEPSRG